VALILVAVPVLGRPHRAAPLAESLFASTRVPVRLLFLCSPGDDAEIAACRAVERADVEVVPWPAGGGDYARKINRACALAGEEWVFTGADDLCFCPSWAEYALETARRTGVAVIGTNDLGNQRTTSGQHSTHSLVRLDYVRRLGTVDEPGKLYHEGYDHQFVDDEMVQTARRRRQFAACPAAEVPHLHPHWGKGDDDATYRKGQARFWEDRALFVARRPLWATMERPAPLARVPARGRRR